MAERDDEVPVRKIAEGVSGLPPKKPKGEPNSKMDADSPYSRSGNYRVMPVWPEYAKGGMVKAGSPKVSAPCRDTKTLKCY